MAKYRDIIFNKKYGALGFIFPLYASIISILILVDILLVWALSQLGINIYYFVSSGGLRIFTYPMVFIKDYFFGANIVFTIPALAILFCGIYLLARAQKYLKEKWRYPLATVTFLTFYQMVIAMYWLLAIVYEVAGTKKIWRGKARW